MAPYDSASASEGEIVESRETAKHARSRTLVDRSHKQLNRSGSPSRSAYHPASAAPYHSRKRGRNYEGHRSHHPQPDPRPLNVAPRDNLVSYADLVDANSPSNVSADATSGRKNRTVDRAERTASAALSNPDSPEAHDTEPDMDEEARRRNKRARWDQIKARLAQERAPNAMVSETVPERSTPGPSSAAVPPHTKYDVDEEPNSQFTPQAAVVASVTEEKFSERILPMTQASADRSNDSNLQTGVPSDSVGANSPPSSPSSDMAAGYDPTQDMEAEMRKQAAKQKAEPVKKAKKEFDMFAVDDDDEDESSLEDGEESPKGRELDESMLDNWDDEHGYLKIINQELLHHGQYRIITVLGKGVFAVVVRAQNTLTQEEVAIKIVRKNDQMTSLGKHEADLLQKIRDADPDDTKHLVRFKHLFRHKGHLCLVFESLEQNLRDLGKAEGGRGLHLSAVRNYARQMFIALAQLKKLDIIHADLKPDNILVSKHHRTIKICDLGSAVNIHENRELTTYLVSRFYRAPEIILGMKPDFGIDMWAIGCTLFELWTGKILFPGKNNNQMLRVIMECRGKLSPKFLKKGVYSINHFTANYENFVSRETGLFNKEMTRHITIKKATKDLRARVVEASTGSDTPTDDLLTFSDLLERCLNMNPEKRITPTEALKHPFIAGTGKGQLQPSSKKANQHSNVRNS